MFIANQVPAKAGSQGCSSQRHWVPAAACPRVLESGAGTTHQRHRGASLGLGLVDIGARSHRARVIPAEAGIQRRSSERHWVPAFAGTTRHRLRGDSSQSNGRVMGECSRRARVIPAEAGIQRLSKQRHWVPAAACPRVLESGAGTTSRRDRGECGPLRVRASAVRNAKARVIPAEAGIQRLSKQRHWVPAAACPLVLESVAGTTPIFPATQR
jgi:hypothetical protein